MKSTVLLLFISIVLIVGGLLMTSLNSDAATMPSMGMRVQTNNPNASVTQITPAKGGLFFAYSAIVFGSLAGVAALIAFVMWFMNRQVVRAHQKPNTSFNFTLNAAKSNSLGAVIAHNPGAIITIVIVLLIVAGILAALATNMFASR